MSDLKEEVKPYVQVFFEEWEKFRAKQRKIEKVAALDMGMDDVECVLLSEQGFTVVIDSPRDSKHQGQRYHFTFEAKEFS